MSSGRPRTLLWQLGLVLMVMQIAVMVALAWYAYDRLADFQHDQTRRDLERLMPILTDDYGPLIEREANDLINERARADGDRVGVRLTIILEDGTVIGDSMADPASMDDHRNRPEIARAFDEGAGTATRFSATLGTRMIYVARRVTTGQGNAAVVRTALAVDQVYEDFAPVVRAIGIAAALSVVLTLAVIYLVSRYYSEQIARVSEGAARFASGDLDHRIARLTTRELSTLAGSLNEMAGQLNQRLTELQRHQRSQRAILQSMSNGVLALDLDHRILEVNRAAERLLELDGDHARGRLLQETVRQPELHHLVASPTATPDRKPVEFVFAGERATRTLQAKRETLTDMDGAPRGLLVVIDDVTELRRLENLRSDFAANVSHELRTPITNIKGYVETLLETSTNGSDETARFLMVVKKNSDRLAAIVEDVLALTRLEEPQAREELDRQRTPIAAVLRSVVAQMSDAAAEKRITMNIRAEGELVAPVHPLLLEQALNNLVSNAIRYSPSATVVTIGAEINDDQELEIQVEDQGPGIPAESIPRLFERFYRVDRARSRELGGTGLGLAIVKHISLIHGGRVEVSSELGRGSTFRLILPTT